MAGPLIRSRKLVLDANGEVRDNYGGEVFMLASSLSTVSVDLTWLDEHGNEAGKVTGVLLGQLIRAGGQFYGYRISGGDPADVLQVLVGPGDSYVRQSANEITIGHVIVDNEIEIKNDAANPIPVEASGDFSTVEKQGAAVAHNVAVAVTEVLTDVLAAGARRLVRLYNQGPDPVAIGSAGLTWANRARVLDPGDSYEDEITGALAIKAITEAAGMTATIGVEVVT